jgi:hypothetical protein
MRWLLVVGAVAALAACAGSAEDSADRFGESVTAESRTSPASSERYQECAAQIEDNPQFQGMPKSSREMMVQANCAGFLEEATSTAPVAGNDRYNECAANIENNPQFAGMPNSSRAMMV